MHSSVVKLGDDLFHLSCGWVVAWAGVYDKTVIELGIVGYWKLSLDEMISNSAYGLIIYHSPHDNLQYPTRPNSITV